MGFYRDTVSPFLDKRNAEVWHGRASNLLHVAETIPFGLNIVGRFGKRVQDPRLRVRVEGIEFESPVMVGAGWDKYGRTVRALHCLGFSGVEVGSVLELPQDGNPLPRLFVKKNLEGTGTVALNRMGFNSPGMHEVARNLERYRGCGIPIGVSIGKNKNVPDARAPEAHASVAERLYDYAAYFVVNVSSPNTPGLRKLQDKGPLTDIVQAVNGAMEQKGRRKPLFVKIAPDLTREALDDVIAVVYESGLSGIIASNTTVDTKIKADYGWENELGGLSGDDSRFRMMSTRQIAYIHSVTRGQKTIIGVGGVRDFLTALEKIKAGATLVQEVTGIRSAGPRSAGVINLGLIRYIGIKGVSHYTDLIGVDAGQYLR